MEQYTGRHYPEGAFLDESGRRVGTHRGAVRYTIGQRKGLGLAMCKPVYVCSKDMEANTVTVGPEESLFSPGLIAEDLNWIAFETPPASFRARAKTRYRQKEQWATVCTQEDGTARILFDEPQRALTVGQSVVLYQDDLVVGGGIIRSAFDPAKEETVG